MALALNKHLREIGRTARAFSREQYPGVREQFSVPRSLRYQQLIDTGPAFLMANRTDQVSLRRARLPAGRQIAAFEAATERKERGAQKRRGGTAGLSVTLKKGDNA